MSMWRKFVYFLALANGERLPAEIVKELLNVNWKNNAHCGLKYNDYLPQLMLWYFLYLIKINFTYY